MRRRKRSQNLYALFRKQQRAFSHYKHRIIKHSCNAFFQRIKAPRFFSVKNTQERAHRASHRTCSRQALVRHKNFRRRGRAQLLMGSRTGVTLRSSQFLQRQVGVSPDTEKLVRGSTFRMKSPQYGARLQSEETSFRGISLLCTSRPNCAKGQRNPQSRNTPPRGGVKLLCVFQQKTPQKYGAH